jgi:hypothetical protein
VFSSNRDRLIGNPAIDFRGAERHNDTHAFTADPVAVGPEKGYDTRGFVQEMRSCD